MFTVSETHRLSAPSIYDGSGNFSPNRNITPGFIVIHYTVISYQQTIQVFGPHGPKQASAHLVISRQGEVTQMVDFNRRAWHAGVSSWQGIDDLNSHSIGIELENHGFLHHQPDGRYVADNGDVVSADQVIKAQHKNPAWHAHDWETYTPRQIEVCTAICQALCQHYPITAVLGHDDIAPDRKADPGPAFPMAALKASLGLGQG